jgi:hypothetical protein
MGSISEFNTSWYHFVQATILKLVFSTHQCHMSTVLRGYFLPSTWPNCAQPNRELICLAESRRIISYKKHRSLRHPIAKQFVQDRPEGSQGCLSSPLLGVLKHASCITYIEYGANEISCRVWNWRVLNFWASSKVWYSGRRHRFENLSSKCDQLFLINPTE